MAAYFITESEFGVFVAQMMKAQRVVAPVAKKKKFMYEELLDAADLRLDFDTTLLPPKKAIMPPHQELVSFKGKEITSSISPVPQVLFGVHWYDVKAIDMLDVLFERNHRDNNYLAYREMTTVVISNIQTVSDRAFWQTVGKGIEPKGHDAWLTRIKGGYHFECRSTKGEALLKFGKFAAASVAQITEAEQVNKAVLEQCPEKLNYSTENVAKTIRESFKKKGIWAELSKDCFSCGTCNIVCPTCYCFDVRDEWHLDQESGARTRHWDGCLLRGFSEVSLGGGATENFREDVAERFRHRVMRKTTYLNPVLGGPACVGCGRCSAGCVPDIADPVKIIDRIMEDAGHGK